MCGKAGSWVGPAAYLLACAALAVLLEPYDLYRFTHAGTFAIAIVGLNLLAGQCGQLSIGHGAFFAAGAYAVAIATSGSGVPVPAALAAAVALGFALGCGLGWPASRLGNVHLTLVTWGLALVVPQVLKSSHVERWTGGTQGIYLDRSPPPSWFPAGEDHWWFGVTALGLLGVLTMARRLIRGRRGRTWRALRDHELASRALGIDVTWERTIAFGVSAACAALGGGIAALLSDFIAPDGYTVFLGLLLLVGAVLGGIHSAWGAVAGGLFVQFAPDLTRDASASLSFPLFGFLLVAAVWLFPGGLAGALERFGDRAGPAHSSAPRAGRSTSST